ncbi:MAG: aldo/keto reductase [Spirochaetes bacterium]|nr:aldo/keto reductase [Spirochaetota bacterium]
MEYRTLGRTGIRTSCIGFGGIPLTGLNGEEALGVLTAALSSGINFIDTARGYKESEELIGRSIADRRDEYCLATKTKVRGKDSILTEFETSVAKLKTDVIDLYQIHYVNTKEDLQGVLAPGGALSVFRRLQREGTVRYVGITGHNPAVLKAAAETGEFDTVQGAFSYIEKGEEVIRLIRYCKENGIGFIAQKPLAGGALLPAEAALRFILGHPVSVVIPGMLSVEQVEENSRAGDGRVTLTAREEEALEAVASGLGSRFCRRCYYCQPACPQNIRVGVILEFLGKAERPENLSLMRRWYAGMPIKASECTECGLCLPECPYELPIVEMLKEAHELLG